MRKVSDNCKKCLFNSVTDKVKEVYMNNIVISYQKMFLTGS